VSDYTPNVTTSDISILGSDEIETLKSNIKNYLDSVVYAPDLLPVINPVMAAGPNDCPIMTPTANIAMYSRYECATEERLNLKQYAMNFTISYASMVGGYTYDYNIVDVYNDIHSDSVTILTEALLLAKTPTEYLDIVEEVYNALSTYHSNSHLFVFEPFTSGNFVINAGSECVHTYTVEYEYECLLRNHEHWGVGKTGNKIAKTITITDETVPAEWVINVEDYLSQLNQNEFPFTELPEGYDTGDELKFLSNDQITTVKMHVSNAIQSLIGFYGMPQIDVNNDFSLSDSSCNDISYEFLFSNRCMIDYYSGGPTDDYISYWRYNGKQIKTSVTIKTYTNGIWTDTDDVDFKDYNPYATPDFPVAWGFHILQRITEEQAAVVQANVITYLQSVFDPNLLPEIVLVVEDSTCIPNNTARVYDYFIPKCAIPAQGIKYATIIAVEYLSGGIAIQGRTYNIVDFYNLFNPTAIITEEDLLSMTEEDYLAVVENVYEGIQSYHTNSDLFTFEEFSTEGLSYDAITTDSECDEPSVNTETVAYYCHEVERWIYDDTRLTETYTIIRTSGAVPGWTGFRRCLLSDIQGTTAIIPSIQNEPAANDGWTYCSKWESPKIQINGKNHTGYNGTNNQNYYPAISFVTLNQTFTNKGIINMNLCILTSKKYAFVTNADDYFDIYLDNVRIAYKRGTESGNHWPAYVFEVYIPAGNHILRYECWDAASVAYGGTLEIFDDIEVLFTQYDTRAEKVAAFTQHRVLSILDYMYDVYTESSFITRAYGLVPFYSLSAADIADGWQIVANEYDCRIIAAKKQILGYSGFRIAEHILWDNNGILTAAINSLKYPGRSTGDHITVSNSVYEVTHVFDVPSDLIANKDYYKANPVMVETVPVVYYDNAQIECEDNAVISDFRWEDYSGQTGEIEVEAFDVDEVEAENVDVLVLRSNIISGQTDTDGNHSQVAFSASYPNGISNPSSVFVEDLNNGMIRVTKNETSSPRKDLIKYTQAGTGEELYLSIIQWASDFAPAAIYTLSESLPDRTLGCFAKKLVINIVSHLNGRYHPVQLTTSQSYIDTYLDGYSINRKQGSFDTAEVVLNLKQNLTTTTRSFTLTFTQDDSNDTVSQNITMDDCRNTKDTLDVSIKRAYYYVAGTPSSHEGTIYMVGDRYVECRFTALLTIEAYDAAGNPESDSATVSLSNVTGYGAGLFYENVETIDNKRTINVWCDMNDNIGTDTAIENKITITFGTVTKKFAVMVLRAGSTDYDAVSPCFE
jgi:hypothetical protein